MIAKMEETTSNLNFKNKSYWRRVSIPIGILVIVLLFQVFLTLISIFILFKYSNYKQDLFEIEMKDIMKNITENNDIENVIVKLTQPMENDMKRSIQDSEDNMRYKRYQPEFMLRTISSSNKRTSESMIKRLNKNKKKSILTTKPMITTTIPPSESSVPGFNYTITAIPSFNSTTSVFTKQEPKVINYCEPVPPIKKEYLPNLEKCKVRRVGTPLYNAHVRGVKYGTFLKDAMPRRKGFSEKIWITKGYNSHLLYEYNSLNDLDSNRTPSTIYHLPQNYYGTGHVIYQGSFFYHSYNQSDRIIRYDLHLKRIVANITLDLPKNETNPNKCRVYTIHREHIGCIDFSVDENGLWFIFRNGSREFIYVSKLNLEDFTIQKTIKIELYTERSKSLIKKQQSEVKFLNLLLNNSASSKVIEDKDLMPVASSYTQDYDRLLNGFVICGKIYFLEYRDSMNATIKYVFDLYNINQFNYLQSIKFLQPFQKNTQLTYNPYDQKIYAWDSEYLLTYSLELIKDQI